MIDVDNAFRHWLERIDARYVLIRPDFYVALTANSPQTLRERLDMVLARLHLQEIPALAAE